MKQHFEQINDQIRQAFIEQKRAQPERFVQRLHFSWSNWGFGMEDLAESCARLQRFGISYIELHGNHYGPDLGYPPNVTRRILEDHGLRVSGVCGMFSADNDLSSNRPIHRQAAIDYIRREVDFVSRVEGVYLLVCPAAVGRPQAYDDSEILRSLDTLARVADVFTAQGVRGAIEPIRSAETSIVHTFAQAKAYIDALNHPGVRHLNGDLYHMLVEERHIAQALWDAGEQLTNLHMADTNRCALGEGSMDLDTIIMALYLIGYNNPSCFVTPEPLGPGGDPYPAQHALPDSAALDRLVGDTVGYFRQREEEVLALV